MLLVHERSTWHIGMIDLSHGFSVLTLLFWFSRLVCKKGIFIYPRKSIVRAGRIKRKICSRTWFFFSFFQTGHSLLFLLYRESRHCTLSTLIVSFFFFFNWSIISFGIEVEQGQSSACCHRDRFFFSFFFTTRHDRHVRWRKKLAWFEWARTKDSFHFSNAWVSIVIVFSAFRHFFFVFLFSFFSHLGRNSQHFFVCKERAYKRGSFDSQILLFARASEVSTSDCYFQRRLYIAKVVRT